jgi:hypothetical protein
MTATTTETAGGARGIPDRPALSEAEQARRAARPVRDPDPIKNARYWARVDACVDAAPPLTDEQRAVIRAAIHAPATREAA